MSEIQRCKHLQIVPRILTIDDNQSILADYRKVLLRGAVDQELAALEASLFDTPSKRTGPETSYPSEFGKLLQTYRLFCVRPTQTILGRKFQNSFVVPTSYCS